MERVVATFNAYSLEEAKTLLQAQDMSSAIHSFREQIRSMSKHGPRTIATDQLYHIVCEQFGEFMP